MRFGSYEVQHELGRGGSGIVYRARSRDGPDVALKVMSAVEDGAFERELRLLWSFSQADGFVPVIDSGTDRGKRFIVMPLLEGGTLRALLQEGPLPVAEATGLVARIAEAMGRAHERGVIHRDLKPENVLMDAKGAPLVADLGLAKHFRRDLLGASKSASVTEAGFAIGTTGYMAPEQLVDSRSARPACDVFALGTIIYEALTGRKPFDSSGVLAYSDALLRAAPEPPSRHRPEVPRWLDQGVLRALAREESARFADGRELARALHSGRAPGRGRLRLLPLALVGLGALAWAFWPRAVTTVPGVPGPTARELAELALKKNRARDLDGAIACATSAVALDPGLGLAWAARGLVRCSRRDLDGALADETRAIELDPRLARAWAFRAMVRRRKNDLDAALEDFARAIALDPGLAAAYMERGLLQADRNERDAAIEDETRAIELDPTLASAWAERGTLWFVKGDLDRATLDLAKAVELDPNLALAWVNLGGAHLDRNQLDEAIADLSRALELDPTRIQAWLSRGGARRRTGDLAGALGDFTRASEIDPSRASAWLSRGETRMELADLDGALSDLTRAIELDPRVSEAWAQRGLALLQRGDIEGAIRDLEKALALDPDGPMAAAVREDLEAARKRAR